MLGEKHPNYANSLNDLAVLYYSQGDYAKAEPLYRQTLDIQKQFLGEKHPNHASSLNNLALLHKTQGDYAKAEPLYRQALDIRKQVLGEKHPDYAISLHNLAGMYYSQRDYAKAEPLYRQTLEIHKQVLGEKHPHYAQSLNNLALLYSSQGDYAKAEPLYRQALEIMLILTEHTAAVQSERQQLLAAEKFRYPLDHYLSLGVSASLPTEPAYAYLLAQKGAVFARQRHLRLDRALLADGQEDFARLYHELEDISRQLGTLAFAPPDPKKAEAWRKRYDELTERKERLEANLSAKSALFRKEQAQQRLTPAQLQAALPADVALVDFFVFAHTPKPAKGEKPRSEQHLAAFVVRPKQAIQLIDLGPVETIQTAVEKWRLTLKRTRSVMGDDDPAITLRQRVWEPLEKHLAGARVVLLSPDGPLSQLPFAALPGKDPEKYLIEEIGLAVVPVPQLIPELLANPRQTADKDAALLLVGEVDFNAEPGKAELASGTRSAPRSSSGERQKWNPLPATREEVVAIKDTFGKRYRKGKLTELREEEPTKAAVREAVTGHRYLHFATHGYFAPPEIKSALDTRDQRGEANERTVVGYHPGLLSGLVLAGANRPPAEGQEDGILTALEVAELDLRGVDLAVLSACETGLGKATRGEGVLGVQRSFQVAAPAPWWPVCGAWTIRPRAPSWSTSTRTCGPGPSRWANSKPCAGPTGDAARRLQAGNGPRARRGERQAEARAALLLGRLHS